MTILAAFAGVAVGCGAAAELVRRARQSADYRRSVAWLVLVGLAVRLAFALLTPIYHAPDERSHLNFISFVDREGRLPVQEQLRRLEPGKHNWQYHQPPLYYIFASPIHRICAEVLDLSPDAAVRTLRVFSIAIWLAVIAVAWLFLGSMQLRDDARGLVVMAVLCLLPTYAFISSVISNDGLTVLMSVLFYAVLARDDSWRSCLAGGVCIGLAIWSKQNGVALALAAIGTFCFRFVTRRMSLPEAAGKLALTGGMALLVWAPVAVRHILLYGSVTGGDYYYAYLREEWTLRQVISYLIKTFVAAAGEHNVIQMVPSKVGVAAVLGLAALALTAILCRRRFVMDVLSRCGGVMWGGLFAAGGSVLIAIQIGLVSGTGQGRHMFPSLLPMAAIGGSALLSWLPERHQKAASLAISALLLIYLCTFVVYSLLTMGEPPP